MSSGSDDTSGGASRHLELPARLARELARQARAALPEECCGMLMGSVDEAGRARVHRLIPAENEAASGRERQYRVPPLAILDAQRQARANGLEILGYYHSHPRGSASPSALDLGDAWPDTSYVILGMQNGELAQIKSWRLDLGDAGFIEEKLSCSEP